MLKAKRLVEYAALPLSEDMNCSSQSPRPTKRTWDVFNDGKVNGLDSERLLKAQRQKHESDKAFDRGFQQLKAFKANHGHLRVTSSNALHLLDFCLRLNAARWFPEQFAILVITEERIKALNDLGFEWHKPKPQLEIHKSTKRTTTSVEECIEDLKAFKEKHGHVCGTLEYDQSRGDFTNMKSACRGIGSGTVINEDRIHTLDELGFAQSFEERKPQSNKTFEEHIEDLRAFKDKYGHAHVCRKLDNNLSRFCERTRALRRMPAVPGTGMTITEERIKALDELGFDWEGKKKSFEQRIEDLQAFKEKHGHVRVTAKHDKSLSAFCAYMRTARRNPGGRMNITEDRYKLLNDLGFDWGELDMETLLKAQRQKWEEFNDGVVHGLDSDIRLKAQRQSSQEDRDADDKEVGMPANNTDKGETNELRNGEEVAEESNKETPHDRGTGSGTVINEDRIHTLDELGFARDKHESFEERKPQPNKTFEEHIEDLRAFKDKYGHVRVRRKLDNNLSRFCERTRALRRMPAVPGTGMTIAEERIKALDELGFDWEGKNNSFKERVEELKAFKEKHGHTRVTKKHDKSLSAFCAHMRSARRNPGGARTITGDRIKALEDLGFDWGTSTIRSRNT